MSGPVVIAENMRGASMYELVSFAGFCYVLAGVNVWIADVAVAQSGNKGRREAEAQIRGNCL